MLKVIRIIIAFSLFVLACSCHPFFMFYPKKIKTFSHANENPDENITVLKDKYGIPYIKASHTLDTIYGLGYMHARDRLFQLDMIRHAARGKLAELFGKKELLKLDKKFRILTYKLDEQVYVLDKKEKEIIKAYVKGINEGAHERGRSVEHFILGKTFKPFKMRDVIAIARLQSWQLAADLKTELVRLKIAKSNVCNKKKGELFAPVDDRNAAIINGDFSIANQINYNIPFYAKSKKQESMKQNGISYEEIDSLKGSSNAWVISKHLTKNNISILMNDPHLRHYWPSNFYIATIHSNKVKATGASFVGVPAILIGASDKISWGTTASYMNLQDLVYLKRYKENKLRYIVDDEVYDLKPWPQKFCVGEKSCVTKDYYVSKFGPIIDSNYDEIIDDNDLLAVMWTGFLIKKHKKLASHYLDLANAKDVVEATDVISSMTLPGVNVIVADDSGGIGYSFAGVIPKRDISQHPFLPLDGTRSASMWPGVLKKELKPNLVNPSSHYIVTANQNTLTKNNDPSLSFAMLGVAPYRAMRIKDRLNEIIKKKKIVAKDLIPLHLDDFSVEAMELSHELGKICQTKFNYGDTSKKVFAKELANFNGKFHVDSFGALPYQYMVREIILERAEQVLGDEWANRSLSIPQIRFIIKDALRKELEGESTALFEDVRSKNDNKHLFKYVSNICDSAYNKMVKKTKSKQRWTWRYGRFHYLKRESPLAKAPIIGGFFSDKRREIGGSASSPMAEKGLPVTNGAALRFMAQMTNPPKIDLVIDAGNSGVVGHENSMDQVPLWHKGKMIRMSTSFKEAKKKAKHSFILRAQKTTVQ